MSPLFYRWMICLILSQAVALEPSCAADSIDFDKQIAPLLAARCLECHAGTEPQAGLDLSRRQTALAGGDNGVVLVAGDLEKSRLWELVLADEMPPKHPLTAVEKDALRKWITVGVPWGAESIDRFRYTTDRRAGYDWWSLRPLQQPSPPELANANWSRNGIDNFILAKLQSAGLSPSPQANARSLMRRLYFDLLGLPPTSDEIAKFEKDPSDEAYLEIVNELLESPRYGERWGRHWLDIVRFGESNGFERNSPRRNFWYYRDWVIQALNDDLPYDEFVRMQLIGDLEKPGPQGVAAAGFLVAGVHNTVIGQSVRMQKLARQDELEELVGTICQTFLGLTANCARCHDHKFDPIRQVEYYRLTATLAGVNHGERTERSADEELQIVGLNAEMERLSESLARIDAAAREAILKSRSEGELPKPKLKPPTPYAQWEFDDDLQDRFGNLHGKGVGSATLQSGALVLDGASYVETAAIGRTIKEKTLEAWVQLETLDQSGGGVISLETESGRRFDSIVFAEKKANLWMAGSDGFVRTNSFEGPQEQEATSRPVHVAIVYQADGTIIGYRDGKPYGRGIRKSDLVRYDENTAHILFGLRHQPAGGDRYLRGKIWRASLYDRALSADEVALSAGARLDYVAKTEIFEWLSPQQREQRERLTVEIEEYRVQLEDVRENSKRVMYSVAPTDVPASTKFLHRGDIDREGEVVTPGGVASVAGVDAEFQLAANAADSERRRQLAAWITGENNSLFARVIVNRIWHYHFGNGLVDTPSDFGFNGGRPSHPELIDWLADQLKAGDFRLKSLHRLMVTSSTYRQSSAANATAQAIDADNRLLWRMKPRRLEAEVIRDSMLAVAGKLNLTMGGAGFEDVTATANNGTTYYEPLDVDGDVWFRRTIYRFSPRGGRSALLDTFDCPDPSATAPRRAVTTTPLQALSLLNNAFVLRMSHYFSDRIVGAVDDDMALQVDYAWQLAVGRKPNEYERQLSVELVDTHGLVILCRGLFNTNEFVIVD